MNYFEWINTVLERRFPLGNGESYQKRCKEIRDFLSLLHSEYKKDKPTIPYAEPLCRVAYWYQHVVANAAILENTITNSPFVRQKLKSRVKATLTICSIGGGPGTDVL